MSATSPELSAMNDQNTSERHALVDQDSIDFMVDIWLRYPCCNLQTRITVYDMPCPYRTQRQLHNAIPSLQMITSLFNLNAPSYHPSLPLFLHVLIFYDDDLGMCLPLAFDFGVSPIWSPIHNSLASPFSRLANICNQRTWRKRLLQLLSAVGVLEDEGVQVLLASDLELDLVVLLVLLYPRSCHSLH